MDRNSADILNRLTRDFYRRCAASFSATRERPWDGWERCVDALAADVADASPVSVLDIGCGNLRFEAFLEGRLRGGLDVHAIDDCPELLDKGVPARFQRLDIVSALLDGTPLAELIEAPACDLTCAFGIMHHIPGTQGRLALLDAMLAKTLPGGYAMLSLWQFERDARLSRKARETTARALELHPSLVLDEGDWLLGWQDEADVFRYCHSFDDEEIDAIVDHAGGRARLVTRFEADGPGGDSNCYLVLRRLG